jgi:hypothetical protein
MTKQEVQHTEQRSIAIHDVPQSLPAHKVDRTIYNKTPAEKDILATRKIYFKQFGNPTYGHA